MKRGRVAAAPLALAVASSGAVASARVRSTLAGAASIDPGLLYVRSPAAMRSGRPRLRARSPRTSTGSARCSTSARNGWRSPTRPHLRAAVSAARSDDDARSVFQHRLSVRRDFPREPYPGGPGRAGSGHRAAEKGLEAQPTKWQYMQDSGSSTTGTCATTSPPPRRFSARRTAWRAELDAAAGRRDAGRGGDRTPSRRCGSSCAQSRGAVAARIAAAAARSTQLDAMDDHATRGSVAGQRAAGCSRRRRSPRRSVGHAVRRSIRRPATSRSRASRSCFPLPGQLQPPR